MKPTGEKIYKRRQVLIKKPFQLRFALLTFSLFFLAALMVWWEIFQTIFILSREGIILDPTITKWINRLNTVLIWKTGIGLALVWVFSILVSHYIAGPIYRIEKSLEALGKGNLMIRVRLRKYDEFQFLADRFNASVKHLADTIRQDREKITQISDELEKLSHQKNVDPHQISALSETLKEMLKTFKVS